MLPPDEPDDRVPCPDGACTGVLGPDGTCGTCGRVGERPPAASPATSGTPAPIAAPTDADRDAALEANPEAILESAAAAAVTAADADERVPCDDGTCTGVIGPDGRCGTCGRRAA